MSVPSVAAFIHSNLVTVKVYIFEVVEVVPDLSTGLKRWYQLKLCCRDDAKGPVTALCGMDNYLVSSMGQKVSAIPSVVILSDVCRVRSSSERSIWTNDLWGLRS